MSDDKQVQVYLTMALLVLFLLCFLLNYFTLRTSIQLEVYVKTPPELKIDFRINAEESILSSFKSDRDDDEEGSIFCCFKSGKKRERKDSSLSYRESLVDKRSSSD